MAGDVRRVGRARLTGGAEGALRDSPVLGAREDRAPMLELVDVIRRLVAKDLDGVLVTEVVRAFDGVVGVLFRVVLGRVSERSVDPALGCAGVAADGMDLREKSDVGTLIVRLDGRAHARAAGAYDEHVVRGFHCSQTLQKAPLASPRNETCIRRAGHRRGGCCGSSALLRADEAHGVVRLLT